MYSADGQALFHRALDLMESNQLEEALPILQELHRRDPKDARVNFSLALAYREAGEDYMCLQMLKKSASVAKKKGIVFEELARAHMRHENGLEAIQAARKAIAIETRNPDMHALLGDVYVHQDKTAAALLSYERALTLQPDHVNALVGVAEINVRQGKVGEAEALLRRAVSSTHGNASTAFNLLSLLDKRFLDIEDVEQIETQLSDTVGLPRKEVARLHFAAGRIADKCGDVPRAFEHYEVGHALFYPTHNSRRHEAQIEAMQRLFTPDFFAERAHMAHESRKPIFVFGMPRSGTTLVEQILNRHSQVRGLGELSFFGQQYPQGLGGLRPQEFVQAVTNATHRDMQRISRKYLALINKLAPDVAHTVDKMPHNFEKLWLMALLFPNATFIHCTRQPIDTCVSIYTNPLGEWHSYNRDQTTLGQYYRGYRELMDHWRAALPVQIRDQSYEALVADQEGETRALVAHAGLNWEDQCLEFYKGEQPVRTFSKEQVRKPIYTSSVDRWRKYEAHLQPLLQSLGDLAPDPRTVKPDSTAPIISSH